MLVLKSLVRNSSAVVTAYLLGSFLLGSSVSLGQTVHKSAKDSGWVLTWHDEFNAADGSRPDPNKWTIMEDGSGFGNHELEYYTSRPVNIHLEKGNLVITARKEAYTGKDGVKRDYTSGRLETAKHFQQKYGRFEARIKLSKGQGIWPAFWLLGNDIHSKGWPDCGEIDIVENVGFEPSKVHGTLHGPKYSGGHALTAGYSLPADARFSDAFHIFAVEWEPESIRFYVDDKLYATQTPKDIPADGSWAFDHPFFVLLNLAVGGDWPGYPDATTVFPVSMLVDYVRVYQRKDESAVRQVSMSKSSSLR